MLKSLSSAQSILPRATLLSHARCFSTQTASSGPTGIVMLNLGGPANQQEVEPFLTRLFSDRTIIQLPFQRFSGPLLAKRRAPKVAKLYESIGGGSPIRKWTEKQGEGMVRILDKISPETAPHKYYIGFRYAAPLADETLLQMQKDGVKRAVAFSQYPQYSCATTGSSLINLWQTLDELKLTNEFKWSIIDRWSLHPKYIKSVAKKVKEGLDTHFSDKDRHKVVIVFSAHSLPMRVVDRGDPYPLEISASVTHIMQELELSNPYMLTYQSKVGPVPWLSPQTEHVIRKFAKQGRDHVLIVPISFTSDHIETLSEIDIELAKTAEEVGMKMLRRASSLNDDPLFVSALADIVAEHLKSNEVASKHFFNKCPGCNVHTPHLCRTVVNPHKQLIVEG